MANKTNDEKIEELEKLVGNHAKGLHTEIYKIEDRLEELLDYLGLEEVPLSPETKIQKKPN